MKQQLESRAQAMLDPACERLSSQAHSFSDQQSFLDLIDQSLQQILPTG